MAKGEGAFILMDAAQDMRRPSTKPVVEPDPKGNRAERRAWNKQQRARAPKHKEELSHGE